MPRRSVTKLERTAVWTATRLGASASERGEGLANIELEALAQVLLTVRRYALVNRPPASRIASTTAWSIVRGSTKPTSGVAFRLRPTTTTVGDCSTSTPLAIRLHRPTLPIGAALTNTRPF